MKLARSNFTLVAGFVVAMLLLGLASWLNLQNVALLRQADAQVRHTHEVRVELRQAYQEVQDLQTGARGFVITGDTAFLSPFERATRFMLDRLRRLCALVADNSIQVTHCAELTQLFSLRMANAQELVETRRNSGFEAARSLVAAGSGKALMDDIRVVVAKMEGEEMRLLALRSSRVAEQDLNATRVAGISAGLSAILLVAIFMVVLRERSLRAAAQAERDRFFDLSADLLCVISDDGRFRLVSPAFKRLLGHSAADLLNRPFIEFVHPDDRAPAAAELEKLSRDALHAAFEIRYRLADGSWKWLSWNVQAFRDDRSLYASARDVTQAKASLDALRASEQSLAVTLQSISDGILTTDEVGRVTRLNRVAEALTGWRQADAIGRPSEEIYRLREETTGLAGPSSVHETLASGQVTRLSNHVALLSRDGTLRAVEDSCAPIRDRSDRVIGAVLMFRDVTEASQLARALRVSESFNRSIVQSSPDCLVLLEVGGRIEYMGPQGCRLMEVDAVEQVERLDWVEMWTGDDRSAAEAAVDAARNGRQGSFRGHCLTFRGNRKWWDVVVSAIPAEEGGAGKLLVFARDISGQEVLDQAVRRANRFLESVIENIPSMLFVKDAKTLRFVRVNRAGECLFGLSREQLIGRSDADFLPAEQAAFFRIKDEELLASGQSLDIPVEPLTSSDGSVRLLHTRKMVLLDESGEPEYLLGISADITERQRAEAEIRALNDTLRENTVTLDKARMDAQAANEAKSAFLASMSHEIRTPMNGVIGMLDVLHQSSLSGHQLEMVALIQESAVSLLAIIEDVLDFSKIEAGKLQIELEPMSLARTIENSCRLLDSLAQRQGVELTMFCDPKIPPEVLGDSLRFRQILTNLVNNAIKFSGEAREGKVSVRATLVQTDARRSWVELTVVDNGIGMDETTQSRLFQRFSQGDVSTTRRFGGTGLGLAISHHLATLMGGSIEVKSAPECGAVFRLRLPFEAPDRPIERLASSARLDALDCVVIGPEHSQAADFAAYLIDEGAVVERQPDVAGCRDSARRHGGGLLVYIIDALDEPHALEHLQVLAAESPGSDARFVVIGRGTRRLPSEVSHGVVTVDGNVLDRATLVRSVEMAVGRFHDDKPLIQGQVSNVIDVLSRNEAIARGRLCLVAEDNETNRKVIQRQLVLLGITADVAANGRIALECWRTGEYSLLLSDLHMPLMDGYQLAAAIRAEEADGARIPIIALSANTLREERQRCIELGMDDYLSKPARLQDLEKILRKWLPLSARDGSPLVEANAGANPGGRATAVVDLQVLEDLIGDDPVFIDELVGQFRTNAAGIVAELTLACRNGTGSSVQDAAHRLKSAANSIGALKLGRACESLENAANSGESGRLQQLTETVTAEMAAVELHLAARKQGTGP